MKPSLKELTEEFEEQLILDKTTTMDVLWKECRNREGEGVDYMFNFTLYGEEGIESIQGTTMNPKDEAKRMIENNLGENSAILKSSKGNTATFLIDYTTSPIETQ